MAPFYYGWGSTASRLQPLRGGSFLFTIHHLPFTIHTVYFLPYKTVPNPVEQPGPLGLQLYVQDSSYRPLAVTLFKMTLFKIYNCSTPYQNQKIQKGCIPI